jgi:hypothetical protein
MKKLFYSIISSGLVGAKSNDPSGYVFTTFIVMSIMIMFFIGFVNRWFNAFGLIKILNIVEINHIISKNYLTTGRIHAFLNEFVLSLIISYFLIYFNKNYIKIPLNYPQKNGNKFIVSIFLIMLFSIISALLLNWLSGEGILNKPSYMNPIWTI